MQYTFEMSDNQNNKAFSMIADIEGDFRDLIDFETPNEVPILPVRNLVLFPGVVSPILIGRQSSMTLVKRAENKKMIIGMAAGAFLGFAMWFVTALAAEWKDADKRATEFSRHIFSTLYPHPGTGRGCRLSGS